MESTTLLTDTAVLKATSTLSLVHSKIIATLKKHTHTRTGSLTISFVEVLGFFPFMGLFAVA